MLYVEQHALGEKIKIGRKEIDLVVHFENRKKVWKVYVISLEKSYASPIFQN